MRTEAQGFFEDVVRRGRQDLCTSAEVMQELLHAYIPVERRETLDAALTLVESCIPTVWPIEVEDVQTARLLADHHAGLGTRDLLHIAICRHHSIAEKWRSAEADGAVLKCCSRGIGLFVIGDDQASAYAG